MLACSLIDPRRRVVMVKFSRCLTFGDLQKYIAGLRHSAAFDPSFRELVDLSEVTSAELNYGQSALLSGGQDPFSPQSQRAFVIVNETVHDIVRMYLEPRNGPQDGHKPHIRIFRTLEEAESWLGLV